MCQSITQAIQLTHVQPLSQACLICHIHKVNELVTFVFLANGICIIQTSICSVCGRKGMHFQIQKQYVNVDYVYKKVISGNPE